MKTLSFYEWLGQRYTLKNITDFQEEMRSVLKRYVGLKMERGFSDVIRAEVEQVTDLHFEYWRAHYRIRVEEHMQTVSVDFLPLRSEPEPTCVKATYANPLTVTEVVAMAVAHAREKGFLEEPVNLPTLVALIHEEASEIIKELRTRGPETPLEYEKNGKPEGIAVELADVVLRACTMAGYLGIDLNGAIQRKMAYNNTRPEKHGRNF